MDRRYQLAALIAVLLLLVATRLIAGSTTAREALPVPKQHQQQTDRDGRVYEPAWAGHQGTQTVHDDPATRGLPAGQGPVGAAASH